MRRIEPTHAALKEILGFLGNWFADPSDADFRQRARMELAQNSYQILDTEYLVQPTANFLKVLGSGDTEAAILVLAEWVRIQILKAIPKPTPPTEDQQWQRWQ
jgi:hypothetical protein